MINEEIENLMRDTAHAAHNFKDILYGKMDKLLKEGEEGLVRSHILILHGLMGGELSMSELGNKLQVTKQNITVLVDKLERLGFVERVSSEKDRRVFLIKLNEKGKEYVKVSIEKYKNSFSDTFSKLNTDDLEAFKNAIVTLNEILPKLKDENSKLEVKNNDFL